MFGFIDTTSGEPAPYFSHFVNDGLFPNGLLAVVVTMITVNFSFQGTELIGIAAGESENPEKTVPVRFIKPYGVHLLFRLIYFRLSRYGALEGSQCAAKSICYCV